ncbi:MAG TPA: glycosyltransferase family 4 protein [Candidatus Saccharimonadales bacterium]|nr:glycosyltransferase family 4 protein [Candidatus Saccharimonadales bacterium]
MTKKDRKGLSIGFLYDDTLDSSDGVAQYVKTLGAWLSAQGHSVSYLVGETKMPEWDGGKIYSLSKNLSVKWGGNRLSMSLIPRLSKINQVLKNNRFDVLHVQVPYSPFMAQRVINRIGPQTAVVGTFHVYPANQLTIFGSKILKVIYGGSLRRFDLQMSVSTAAQSYAKKSFGIDSIVEPNVINLSKFGKAEGATKGSKKIVFLGRLVERKGCMHLLRAFAMLKRSVPDASLTIAGDGPQRSKLESFVKRHKLSDSVKFLGYINERDKPALLASADIACFPSLYGESFGIVLIEAMAAGSKVVLAGNNVGYSAVLAEKSELLIDQRDSEQFAKRLQELLINEQLSNQLHKWQVDQVKKYDVAEVGPHLVSIYRRAIASRAKSRHN